MSFNKSRRQTKMKNTGRLPWIGYHCCSLILLVISCTRLPQTTLASGVFELELLDFQRLDQSYQASGKVAQTNETTTTGQHNQITSPPMRILICLKEAFTSQLDGLCTFGNASITLGSQQSLEHHTVLPITNTNAAIEESQSNTKTTTAALAYQQVAASEAQRNDQQQQNATTSVVRRLLTNDQQEQQQRRGSLLTNAVRIQFTFRWTKSFTIILSAEQIGQAHEETKQAAANQSARQDNSAGGQPGGLSTQSAAPQLIIDRHVLTENEVLPDLEANIGNRMPWTNRFQRSLKTAIVYRFRVYCALNYFGDGCTTFCRPRNDQFGHYNCSSTGQKVCYDGWYGVDCDKAKCRSGCNQQHGFCDRPNTCQCRPGWTGARCDECITYPGCQNGYCLSPWQCVCQRNWGGVLCDQDLNYCSSHDPCRNNGTCQNVAPGRYKCNCPEGFAGVNCETSLSTLTASTGSMAQLSAGCALNPCLNGGTCYGFSSSSAGETTTPASKSTSEQQNQTAPLSSEQLVDNLLSLGAAEAEQQQQQQQNLLYRCHCPAGWTGDYCQWAESLTVSTDLLLEASSSSSSNLSDSQLQTPSITTAFTANSEQQENGQQKLSKAELDQIQTTTLAAISFIESVNEPQLTTVVGQHHHSQLEMRHLISGVVIASAVGVFVAALMFAWCCLVAIEKNRFSFIQMNVIRQSTSDRDDLTTRGRATGGVSSTLRRMQEKIRDSFRRSNLSIKPETKLSIENVLRPPKLPPPSYEESNYASKLDFLSQEMRHQYGIVADLKGNRPTESKSIRPIETTEEDEAELDAPTVEVADRSHPFNDEKNNLVISNKEVVVPIEAIRSSETELSGVGITSAHLNCPRHGHLYRKQQQLHSIPERKHIATTIEIEYKPATTSTTSSMNDHHYHHHYHKHPRDMG